MTAFYEWVVAGAIFGIKAFFAVFAFLMCCVVSLALLALLGKAVGALLNAMDGGKE